ncbi:transcriptional regulator ArgP [Leifsonia sp. LS1]|uniref:LysR family transcriptional regulator ArgP n=1 Tax=unclassified Leifsonia TaxID=2663824 RepID=UPI001CC098BC|nr:MULTISPECIES: LysR family transcriptional regulator ArgP [unclassified Leifsonia]UAJ78480.1 LysR family transcriptional regulator ArgP [Leifsonia sp. ZF2019]GIT80440.1 transcriptional regulator ArgP [Leifsonia sp. LS1]
MDVNAEHLRTLAAVIDHGTFERAALALHMTPSAVSQRMKALEERAGRVLVRRSKPIAPTDAGRVLLRLARQVALLEEEAAAELGGIDGSTPAIPLVVNADSLATWVLPALASLPHLVFEVGLDDQEHTLDRLRDGTAMAAIGSDADPVQGCTVSPLGAMVYRPVASPAFVARWAAEGWTPEAAGVAPMLVYDRKDALQDRYLARFAPRARPPRQYIPASTEFVRAAELGLGWGMLPDLQIVTHLAEGRLVVLDDAGAESVMLHWHQWSMRSDTLAAVADAIREHAAAALQPPRRS